MSSEELGEGGKEGGEENIEEMSGIILTTAFKMNVRFYHMCILLYVGVEI